jgi:magnesium chelatase family protein
MKLAIIYSRANAGISAPLVTIEVHISKGMQTMHMSGLPEAEVKESKYRVRCALMNSQFKFPKGRRTINLAPADLPKEGGRFDLPIALGILAASDQIPQEKLSEMEFTGELALSGELRPVRGILPMVIAAKQANRILIVPKANAEEAALVQGANVFFANHILEVCAFLKNEFELNRCVRDEKKIFSTSTEDLKDVRGQLHARRALEIAAAGKHSLLYLGPPGTGKTMLASRITSILPPLSEEEALEIAAINSVSLKGFDLKQWQQLPFRSPHHSSSHIALVGGGRPPRPGEVSLSHHGVLFLDELPEFNRNALESLREPLESGHITISRAAYQTIFPAKFQLIAAMNPCPCGFFGSQKNNCRCTSEQVQRYLAKLSGPLLDRIDMQVEVQSLPPEIIAKQVDNPEESVVVKTRVLRARDLQQNRQAKCNAQLSTSELEKHCQLDSDSQNLLMQVMKKFNFSARTYHRLLKVARTIADLEGRDCLTSAHISEALTFRCLDRLVLDTMAICD